MNKINLLPWREENKKKRKQLFKFEIVAVIAFTIFAVIFLHFVKTRQSSFYEQQNKLLQAEIQRLNTENAQLTPFLETQKTLIKNIDLINSLEFHRYIGVKMLNAIVPSIPNDIYLTKIKFDKHSLELQGNATSNIAISKLVDKVGENAIFGPVRISQVSEEKDKDITLTKFQVNTSLSTRYESTTDEKKP